MNADSSAPPPRASENPTPLHHERKPPHEHPLVPPRSAGRRRRPGTVVGAPQALATPRQPPAAQRTPVSAPGRLHGQSTAPPGLPHPRPLDPGWTGQRRLLPAHRPHAVPAHVQRRRPHPPRGPAPEQPAVPGGRLGTHRHADGRRRPRGHRQPLDPAGRRPHVLRLRLPGRLPPHLPGPDGGAADLGRAPGDAAPRRRRGPWRRAHQREGRAAAGLADQGRHRGLARRGGSAPRRAAAGHERRTGRRRAGQRGARHGRLRDRPRRPA